MKLKDLAEAVGKSVPFVMTLQKKYGLPAGKEYKEGHGPERWIFLPEFAGWCR